MASINRESNGRRTIQFVGSDGKRRSIRLGKVPQRMAEAVKVLVEHLTAAQFSGGALEPETARKVAELDDALHKRLAAVGLLKSREAATVVSVAGFLKDYVARRVDVKPATREVWRQVEKNLLDCFGANRDLRTIDEAAAEDFKTFLLKAKLAPTTVAKRLQFARQFFRAAVKRKLISANPFADVASKAASSKDRQQFIPREHIDRLLEACPNLDWRVIIRLSRFGGLRCPSEVLSLKWEAINWAADRIRVDSPKTEHHAGKASREIPLFPELRAILTEAFEAAPEGAVYVVGGNYRAAAQVRGWLAKLQLSDAFERIIRRAGLEPWPRLFHNLRASRETELAAEYPVHVVTAWLGNTPRIAMKHYLMVTEADFQKAVQNPVQLFTKAVQNPVQQPAANGRNGLQETTQAPGIPGLVPIIAFPCNTLQESLAERTGFEPAEGGTPSRI